VAELVLLGRDYGIKEDPSAGVVTLGKRYLRIPEGDLATIPLFLREMLYGQLEAALTRIRARKSVDMFGNLDFQVVEQLGPKKSVIARYKGNKILVKASAVMLPRDALEYVVAHELAHILTSKHSRTFSHALETLYPDFKAGRKAFHHYRDRL
jgi:predicted metal-dependent hydrolase